MAIAGLRRLPFPLHTSLSRPLHSGPVAINVSRCLASNISWRRGTRKGFPAGNSGRAARYACYVYTYARLWLSQGEHIRVDFARKEKRGLGWLIYSIRGNSHRPFLDTAAHALSLWPVVMRRTWRVVFFFLQSSNVVFYMTYLPAWESIEQSKKYHICSL